MFANILIMRVFNLTWYLPMDAAIGLPEEYPE
jgi:hypothetical protein